MNREDFERLVGCHLADIKEEAIELFEKGCAPDKCVELAIAVLDAKAIAKARAMSQAAIAVPSKLIRH